MRWRRNFGFTWTRRPRIVMSRYIVSVIEGAIMLSRTHRDVNVIERQVHDLKEDLKRSFQPRTNSKAR